MRRFAAGQAGPYLRWRPLSFGPMSLRRIPTGLLAAIALVAAAAAAILVNFVLLGFADQRSEPVGQLRARLDQPAPPVAPGATSTDESSSGSDD